MERNVSEALRYLGVRGAPDPALLSQLSAAADRLARAAPPRWVWRAYPLTFGPEGPALVGADLALSGKMAARMLGDCAQAAVLICTLGAAFEALLRAEQARGMAQAALLDACIKERRPGTSYTLIHGGNPEAHARLKEAHAQAAMDQPPLTDYEVGCVISINTGPNMVGMIYRT